MGTSGLRTFGLVAVGILVGLLLVSANLVVAADRTVLDEEFVTDSLEEEGAYEALTDEFTAELTDGAPADTSGEGGALEGPPPEEALQEALTPAYVQNQTEANVERFYGYIHGDREDLALYVETEPLKAELVATARESVMETDLATLDPELAAMAANESAYRSTRAEFRARQYQRIQEETDRELSDEELRDAFDDQRDEIRSEGVSRVEERVAQRDVPGPVADALVDLGTVRVDGLVAEDMSYEEFQADLTEAKAGLADAVAAEFRAEVDEAVPDRMDLTEDMDSGTEERLETAQQVVSVLDLLALVLPLSALGLGAVLVRFSGRRSTGLAGFGAIVLVVGMLSVAAATLARDRLVAELEPALAAESQALADVAVGVLTRTISAVATQSWVLFVLGLLLVAGGVALRRGLLPVADRPGAVDSGVDDEA